MPKVLISELHVIHPRYVYPTVCQFCAMPWPCDTALVLEEARKIQKELDQLRGETFPSQVTYC